MPDWTADQWHSLAGSRRAQRAKPRQLELPPGIDATLHLMAAEKLREADGIEDAQKLATWAVEELPGNEQLIAWEAAFVAGEDDELDLSALISGLASQSTPGSDADSTEV